MATRNQSDAIRQELNGAWQQISGAFNFTYTSIAGFPRLLLHHDGSLYVLAATGAILWLKPEYQIDGGAWTDSGWGPDGGKFTFPAGWDGTISLHCNRPCFPTAYPAGTVINTRVMAKCSGSVVLCDSLLNPYPDVSKTWMQSDSHQWNDAEDDVPLPLWGPIPDTGQTVQYLPGDDADYGWDHDENDDSDGHAGLKYTKFDASGNPLPPGASSWEAVRDDRSGLFYRIAGIGSGTWNDTMTWASQYAGLGKTWRLATTQELLWLVDFSRVAEKLDPMVSALSGNARALTENQTDSTLTWMVNFNNGNASGTAQKNDGLTQYLVIYVSGNQLAPSFQDNGDGTITDTSTGFMWTKYFLGGEGGGSPTTLDWYSAVPAALACSVGGYSDWRMPNLKELSTIIDYQHSPPGINTSVFPVIPASSVLWTSTSYIGATINAWTFTLRAGNPRDNGMSYWFNKTLGFIYAMAVRNA